MTKPVSTLTIDPLYYDTYVDWPRRLANEEPFYRDLINQNDVKTLLDAACGTGRHAAMFHAWGMEVEGADVSAEMIDFCRQMHGESERLRWRCGSFAEPPTEPGKYDAVICTGNSLTLANDPSMVSQAVAAMLAALRPGGVCVIQVRNIFSLAEGPVNWGHCVRLPDDRVLFKSMHRVGDVGYVSFFELRVGAGEPSSKSHSTAFLGLRAADLDNAAASAGADEIRLLGSFQKTPFDENNSTDLILVCRRK